MKLWLDDVRTPPDWASLLNRQPFNSEWLWVKDYDEAIIALSLFEFEYISLDHDLGEGKTGYDVLCWIEDKVANGWAFDSEIEVHSANPVGVRRMLLAMESIAKLLNWNDN